MSAVTAPEQLMNYTSSFKDSHPAVLGGHVESLPASYRLKNTGITTLPSARTENTAE